MRTIITCRMDMMTVAGAVHIGHYRQLSLGFGCRDILINASRRILKFSRCEYFIYKIIFGELVFGFL